MDAVQERLVRMDDKLIQLFDPPFDKGVLQPGYIKGYVPGIRENGGQYTHAATWVALATALQGHGDRAMELWNLINPISHAMSSKAVQHYKVEPYVVAADVYGADPHVGRGGWTWYTGSAGWMVRVVVESLLGVRIEGGNTLVVRPAIPREWPGFRLELRPSGGPTRYDLRVENGGPAGSVREARLDGRLLPSERDAVRIPLSSDGGTHHVRILLE
jgi:cellobiose phosphorylase